MSRSIPAAPLSSSSFLPLSNKSDQSGSNSDSDAPPTTMPPPTPCRSSINDWTIPSLIGSYIDLLLALLFLIGSTLVFLGSALLSLLGLSLPCPCDGLFGCPNCVHARIGSVSRSIRTRFPCENIAFTGYGPDRTHAPAIELSGGDGPVVFGRRPVMGQVRRRRRGRSSWGAGCLSLTGERVSDNFAAVVVSREGEEEETNDVVVSGPRDECVSLVDETAPAIECHSHATEEASSGVRDVYISEGNETTIVHNLEQELKDAQAAYSTLCLELEKERSAAATAADEAMAMILRLQSEKAAMEMESSQYQRMIEEKFAYDEEEMEILKEIIVRREKEKHVLEKEVEAYRQIKSGEMTGKKHDPSLDCSDDPTMLLKTIYESIRKKEKLDGKMRCADEGEGIHQLEFPDPRDEFNLEVQEKGMLTMEIYPSCGQCKSSSIGEDDARFDSNKFQELGFCKDNSCSNNSCSILGEDAEKESKIEVGIPGENLDEEDGQDGEMRDINSSYFETDSNVLDVHVIDDGQNLADARIGKASGASQTGNLFDLFGKGRVTDESSNTGEFVTSIEIPVASPAGVGGDIRRSCSDMPKGDQLLDSPSDRFPFDLRRSSMSAVDNQRFTLATEVEILRKRLKTIQQGREKLTIPLEHQEKERFQLELLEEIACQLQEIRKITDPGKGIRHASLPPLSSKDTSKKRRCRSVSSGLHESA